MGLTQIPDALERIFLARGWYNVYSRFISDLQLPNSSNEMYCRSPWKDTTDSNPSMSVNAQSGLFLCNKTGRTGNYLQFRQWTDSPSIGPDGYLIPLDIKRVEEIVLKEEGIVPPSEDYIAQCNYNLISSQETLNWVISRKPWFNQVIVDYQIGYDWENNSIVIPIRDENGNLINARLYKMNGEEPKMRWLVNGLTGNFLFPYTAINEDNIILVEGEPDAITLRGLGFNAISGTVSASDLVPAGEWYRDRKITILVDEDIPGERARSKSINIMRHLATEVKSARIPEWEGQSKGADISDYVFYLVGTGLKLPEIGAVIKELLENSEIVASKTTIYDMEPINSNFSSILNSERVHRKLEFVAKVAARSEKRYIGVTQYNLNCPAKGHNYCVNCVMARRYNGNGEFYLDRRSADQLKLIGVNDAERMNGLKRINGIPIICPDVTTNPLEWVGYEPTQITATLSESETNNEISDMERHRREAYIVINEQQSKIEENRDYQFTGFLYPDPKTQSSIMVIDTAKPTNTSSDEFKLNENIINQLKSFQPINQNSVENVINCLNERGNDLSESVTGIKGRLDMHLGMSLVWHSAIGFMLGEQKIKRGWLELLILGDTRSGKSVTFRMLAEHYNIGVLVDCKNQTTAGLLGAVNTSSVTGERYISAGLLPQNDKGVVGLDEMEGAKFGRVTLLEALASMRSEGIVRITKAAQAQYRARVRLICMANPGKGLLIKETGKTGAELILGLIPQPENIARFDAALVVSQEEVEGQVILSSNGLTNEKWNVESQRNLLKWIYSRKPEQIKFTKEAEREVQNVAIQMCSKYDSTLPIVEPSDQKTRIAKWAVAIAGFLFSTGEKTNNKETDKNEFNISDYENIIINESHVIAAHGLLQYFYDKYAMGYDKFSQEKRETRILQDEQQIRKTFEGLGQNKYNVARQLLINDEISDRAFKNIVNGPMSNQTLNSLINNNCIKLVYSGKRDSYEKNPTFTEWLQLFISEGVNGTNGTNGSGI